MRIILALESEEQKTEWGEPVKWRERPPLKTENPAPSLKSYGKWRIWRDAIVPSLVFYFLRETIYNP
jgi:hypothetical protein